MKHENIYQHNIRLNLNKEDHLLVHRYLMNADPKEFKSKNDFLIRAVLAGAPSVCQGETVKAEEVEVKLSEEQMKELSLKVVDLLKVEVINEVMKSLLGMIVTRPEPQPHTVQKEDFTDEVEDYIAESAMDYFEE